MRWVNIKSHNATKDRRSAQGGFSLIELIIVVCIMSVLLGLLIPSVVKFVKDSKMQTCRHNREAILAVYQRCIYDTSIQDSGAVPLSNDGLKLVIPHSGTTDYAQVKNEVQEYATCPLGDTNYYNASMIGVDATTKTAWIECATCGDVVSVDLTGMSSVAKPTGTDILMTPTPSPTPTPTPGIVRYTVSFNLNGHSPANMAPYDTQTIDEGSYASKPSNPVVAFYRFKGWYETAALANEHDTTKQFNFGTAINQDYTLYAGWEAEDDADKYWPYPDSAKWWDLDTVLKNGKMENCEGYEVSNGVINAIIIKAPSGIFPSRSGGQFVYVNQNEYGPGNLKIYRDDCQAPEYFVNYGTNNQIVAQLTGKKVTIDITNETRTTLWKDMDENKESQRYDGQVTIAKKSGSGEFTYTVSTLSPGDVIEFLDDDGKTYSYIYWHQGNEVVYINTSEIGKIRGLYNHMWNCYRIGP